MSFATRDAGALIADACMGIGTAPLAMRILLIEEDAMIGRGLLRGLGDQGIAVDWVRTGPDGGAAMKQGDHSLVLLDLGLPGKSGFDLIRHARAAHNSVPILVITARDSLEDRIRGLDLGADDYLIKPFELKELAARMRSILRRTHRVTQHNLEVGALAIDTQNNEAR